ncbi:MAG: O-antigen ligase family protein [Caulobacterales bacterium]|nr:O-antigen ligase family protein [Caulobacterales bacterium]
MSQTTAVQEELLGHAARVRDQVRYVWPANWFVVVLALATAFFWHLAFGAGTHSLSGAFSASWLFLAAVSLMAATSLAPVTMTRSLYVLGGLYALVLVLGALQLTPFAIGGPHPLWDGVESAAPAATLDRDATWREIIKLAALGGAFICGLVIGRSDRRTRMFFSLFLGFAALYGLIALADFFADPNAVFGLPRVRHEGRLSGAYLSADTAAALFGMFGLIAAARLAQAVKESEADGDSPGQFVEGLSRRGGVAAVALLVSAICLIFTASRAGIAATALTLVLMLAWEVRVVSHRGSRARMVSVVLGVMAVLVMAAAAARLSMSESGFAGMYADAARRLVVYQTHWEAFQASPWMGYGYGSFAHVNELMQTTRNWRELSGMDVAHNVVLQWLSEGGVVGAAAMGLVMATVFAVIGQGLSRRRTMKTWLRATLAVSALVVFHSLADSALQTPAFAGQWALILGIAAGLSTSAATTADDTAVAPKSARKATVPRAPS